MSYHPKDDAMPKFSSVSKTPIRGFVCLFVCLGGRQGEADRLNCNPLQRVGIPFFRDLASRPRTLLLLIPSMVLRGHGRGKPE